MSFIHWKLSHSDLFYYLSFCFPLFFYSSPIDATEFSPWLGNFYEFELRSNLRYQTYAWLETGSHHKKFLSNDVFLTFSLCNAIPDPAIGIECEITGAKTRKQNGEIDQLKLTGRYLWLDDIAGDFFSLTTGLSYIQAFKLSLRDESSFHHGLYNAECFIVIGRETPDESLWKSRWWGLFAIGIAEQGSPWLRFNLDYQRRLAEKHEVGLFFHTLWGLGGEQLSIHHFCGYGPVKHESVDVGLSYTYELDYFGRASLAYSYRLYASQCPAYVHQVVGEILWTFGL